MRKVTAVFFAIAMLAVFSGCSDNRFLKDNEIKSLDKNPTGTIIFKIKDGTDEERITMTFELFYDKAPITVTNFVSLAKSGFYDGTYITDYSVSGDREYLNADGAYYAEEGDYYHSYKELDYNIKGEFEKNGWTKNDAKHTAWALSMLLDGESYDSASFRFSVLFEENTAKDGYAAVFGAMNKDRTSEFLTILKGLSSSSGNSVQIESITVDTYGVDLGQPLKLK